MIRTTLGVIAVLAACSRAFITDPVVAVEPSEKDGVIYITISYNSSDYKSGSWIPSNEQLFEYIDNRLKSIQSRAWNESEQQWGAAWKTIYFRDSLFRLTSWHYVQAPFDTANAILSQTYRYNAFGKIAYSATYQRSNNAWKTASYTVYEYDNSQRLIKQIGCNLQALGCDSNVIDYAYPSNSSYTTSMRQIISGVVTNSSQSIITLDSSGNVISSTTESYRKDTLVTSSRSTFKYNQNGWMSELTNEKFENNTWNVIQKTDYQYEEFSDSLLCNLTTYLDTGSGLFEYNRLRTKYLKQLSTSNSIKHGRPEFSGVKITESSERVFIITDRIVGGAYLVNASGKLLQKLKLQRISEGVYEAQGTCQSNPGAKFVVIKYVEGGSEAVKTISIH